MAKKDEKQEESASAVEPAQADISSIIAETMETAPVASEEAIAAHAAREEAAVAAEAGSEEKPAPKKRGRKPGQKNGVSLLVTTEKKKQEINYRRVGEEMGDTIITLGYTLGGEDWKPIKQMNPDGSVALDERANMRQAWGDLAEEYQWTKMPAYISVLIVTGAYIAPRLTAPSTMTRIDRFKKWWLERKIKKAEKAKVEEKTEEVKKKD